METDYNGPINTINADINVFFEKLVPEWFSSAQLNWFVPNPEWYVQDIKLLNNIDLILCRTHEVERIFQALKIPTYFLGFTSSDCLENGIEKDFSIHLHVAGASPHKGTPSIIHLWKHHLDLPNLVLIKHGNSAPLLQQNIWWIDKRLQENTLRHLQNSCGIHLCPSTAEGYGHYIMEAMSTGAVVVTTNGPPMNEFITDSRCLVPFFSAQPCALATAYFVSSQQLAKTLYYLNQLPTSELEKIGQANRLAYLQKSQEFHENLKRLMLSISRK